MLVAVLPAVAVVALLAVGLGVLLGERPGDLQGSDLRGVEGAIAAEQIIAAAEGALRNDDAAKAHEILEQAIYRLPTEQTLRLLLAEAKMRLGDPAGAYEQTDAAIAIGPDHPEYRHAAGMYADEAGLLEQAVVHYGKAQQLDPSNPKYALFLAVAQQKLGRTADAKKNLLVATAIDPSIADAWGLLAEIALQENRTSVGLQHVRRARDLEPASAAWRVIEARLHRRNNDPQRAADVLFGISEFQRSRDPVILEELATCLGQLGDPGRAAMLYVNACSGAPDDSDLHFRAALWLERSGQTERALTYAAEAARRGHAQAAALVDRLAAEG